MQAEEPREKIEISPGGGPRARDFELVFSGGRGGFGPPQKDWFRWSELVLIAYFSYAALISIVLPLPRQVSTLTVGLNLAVVGTLFTLAYVTRLRPSWWALPALRDWLALALVILCYREMGWFAPAQHSFELENSWVVWDRLLLDDWGVRDGIELFGPLLPALLEICYSLVYAVGPLSLGAIYLWGQSDRADILLFPLVLGTVLSYALFPYFPSEPPRTVFPGDLFPSFDNVFRRFNWWLLGGQGIHTSVFPSAHVSSAYAGAFAMFRAMPERKWAGWVLVLLATGIFWATIYGRYHFAVDAVAGLVVAAVAFKISGWLSRRWGAS